MERVRGPGVMGTLPLVELSVIPSLGSVCAYPQRIKRTNVGYVRGKESWTSQC